MAGRLVPNSTWVAIGGRKLHVVEWGERGNPPIVLVHGMRDHARSWDWVATALAGRYHVVAPDLRGHGDSDHVDPSGYAIASFVIDLADVIRATGCERPHVIGHSLGGAIALRYVAAFPERVTGLCGIECVELPIVRDERAVSQPYPRRLRGWIADETKRRVRLARYYDSPAEALARMAEDHPRLDRATMEHFVAHALIRDADRGWRWKYDNAARLRSPDDADGRDLDAALAAITCPVLLCYGTASWIPLPPPERLALLRNHRVATFENASHWLHHEARDAFLTTLTSFLASHSESTVHA